jgi:H+/Cl- antiporter ClcA
VSHAGPQQPKPADPPPQVEAAPGRPPVRNPFGVPPRIDVAQKLVAAVVGVATGLADGRQGVAEQIGGATVADAAVALTTAQAARRRAMFTAIETAKAAINWAKV